MNEAPENKVEIEVSLGIVKELGELPPGTIVEEYALAGMFCRCSTSVKRAVDRGELPQPVRMFGKSCWTVKSILDHIDKRLRAAQQEAEDEMKRIAQFSP